LLRNGPAWPGPHQPTLQVNPTLDNQDLGGHMRLTILVAVIAILLVRAIPVLAQLDLREVAMADSVLAELDQLPEGIRVTHSPNPVFAVEDTTAHWRFTWNYATTVAAIKGEVTVVEFGVLSRTGDQWVYANYTDEPFRGKEFAEWYNCDGSRLCEGLSYIDPSNWSAAGCLKEAKSLWYFIAEDETGRRVKGVAEVRLAAGLVGIQE